MDIATETLQGFLDDAWDAAPPAANSLRDQLRAYEKSAIALFRQGSLSSVSKNSASQSYRGPGLGSYTPVQIASAWRMLINLHDDEKARLDWKSEDDADSSVYAAMKCRLRVCTEYSVDIINLRLEPTISPRGEISW